MAATSGAPAGRRAGRRSSTGVIPRATTVLAGIASSHIDSARFPQWSPGRSSYSSLMDAPTPYPGVTYAAPPPSVPPTLPPVFYDARVASQVPPAMAPPLQRVVEFPTGRYELRGDGIRTPYTWVWIPNPPTEPPPPAGVPSSGDGVPANRSSQIYEWVDEQGVVHWTNRRDTVPPRYRKHS